MLKTACWSIVQILCWDESNALWYKGWWGGADGGGDDDGRILDVDGNNDDCGGDGGDDDDDDDDDDDNGFRVCAATTRSLNTYPITAINASIVAMSWSRHNSETGLSPPVPDPSKTDLSSETGPTEAYPPGDRHWRHNRWCNVSGGCTVIHVIVKVVVLGGDCTMVMAMVMVVVMSMVAVVTVI